jgi:hypothetical protein
MRKIVTRGVEVVLAIFALFGGFITNISPPQHSVSTGLASVIALILFLLIVFTRGGQELTDNVRKKWLRIAVLCGVAAFVLLLIYLPMKDALAFTMPSSGQELIGGFWLSPEAMQAAQKQQTTDPADILGLFGGIPSLLEVWPPPSHWSAVVSLYFLYVLSVCAVLGAIFALTEGIGDQVSGETPGA